MQQLCAKPQYGGGNRYEHIGGFCATGVPENQQYLSGNVFYDLSIGAKSNTNLATPRMIAECTNRCFCSNLTAIPPALSDDAIPRNDINIQPKFIAKSDYTRYARPYKRLNETFQTLINVTGHNYSIQYPLYDKFLYKPRPGEDGGKLVDATRDLIRSEVAREIYNTFDDVEVYASMIDTEIYIEDNKDDESVISINPRNEITCDGPLPPWDLPAPYTAADFSYGVLSGAYQGDGDEGHPAGEEYLGLNSFCAVYQSGGFLSANAGGFCYDGPNGRQVWFSDEMTPRLDWTFSENRLVAVALRFHCWLHCSCGDPPEVTPKRKKQKINVTAQQEFLKHLKTWELLVEPSVRMKVFQTSGGDIRMETVTVQNGTTNTTNVQLIPPTNISTDVLSALWPDSVTAKLGTPPSIPTIAYNTSTQSVGTCGLSNPNTCTSQASCGGTSNQTTCKCAEPDSLTVKAYGLDPVFPSPLCLAITAAIIGVKSSSQPGIGGRGLLQDGTQVMLNGDGEPWRCLCNSTYTSAACCLVDNGIVWEEAAVEKRSFFFGPRE